MYPIQCQIKIMGPNQQHFMHSEPLHKPPHTPPGSPVWGFIMPKEQETP
jgi:hypothetical protein